MAAYFAQLFPQTLQTSICWNLLVCLLRYLTTWNEGHEGFSLQIFFDFGWQTFKSDINFLLISFSDVSTLNKSV
jgi:hypothetical protein